VPPVVGLLSAATATGMTSRRQISQMYHVCWRVPMTHTTHQGGNRDDHRVRVGTVT
jgi:hypothetical protein